MNAETREQAPESYATFWEPLAATPTPSAPSASTPATTSTDAKDAYLEFVNVTEGVHGIQTPARP